jgi:orotate phosphoribosyltransferase
MNEETLRAHFEETGALLSGHFQLSSGLHSPVYFQSALVLQYADRAERIGCSLADRLRDLEPDLVVGPALGGIVIGHEVARALDVRGVFTERKDGEMALRRGFSIRRAERVVVIEDVVTTGKSTGEAIQVIRAAGGDVVGVGAIVDRSGGTAPLDVSFRSLLSLPVEAFAPAECPDCRAGAPIAKPGSRPGAARV